MKFPDSLALTLLLLPTPIHARPHQRLHTRSHVTPRWKTLASHGGWSIRYPATWTLSSCHACPDLTEAGLSISFQPPARRSFNGLLQLVPFADAPPTESLDARIADFEARAHLQHHGSPPPFALNGRPAQTIQYRNPNGVTGIEATYIANGPQTIEVEFIGTGKAPLEKLRFYPVYRKMLASFRIGKP